MIKLKQLLISEIKITSQIDYSSEKSREPALYNFVKNNIQRILIACDEDWNPNGDDDEDTWKYKTKIDPKDSNSYKIDSHNYWGEDEDEIEDVPRGQLILISSEDTSRECDLWISNLPQETMDEYGSDWSIEPVPGFKNLYWGFSSR